MGCCTEVYVPHQGAAVPDSRSLSWSFTFSAVFSPLPVRASLVFLSAESSYGFVCGHERSTTFPWVSSRPVQLGYDRALRGAWLECIRTFGALGGVVAAFVVFEAGPSGGVACWALGACRSVVCAYRFVAFCG